MSEVTIEPGPDDTPTVVPLGAQSASVVSTDGQVVIGGLDATGVDEGYVPTADGADGWAWAEVGGGETQDTGTVTITDLFEGDTNAWDLTSPSEITVRRVGSLVYLFARVKMKPSVNVTSPSFLLTLPAGYRPPAPVYAGIPGSDILGLGLEVWGPQGWLSVVFGQTVNVPSTKIIVGAVTFLTTDAWPA